MPSFVQIYPLTLMLVGYAIISATCFGGATSQPRGCQLPEGQMCENGSTHLSSRGFCDPRCSVGFVALGLFVCRGDGREVVGPGCVDKATLPHPAVSNVDAVPDANSSSGMVFKHFATVNASHCMIWPKVSKPVKSFILEQAGRYGPSAAAIDAAKRLGTRQQTEFFLSIEQVSILLSQLLCGATASYDPKKSIDGMDGAPDHPQAFAFGRAMEHWYFNTDGVTPRDPLWRRTTLVGYGTFDNDPQVPSGSSKVNTSSDLNIYAGCGARDVADWALGDSNTMTVVFAGHYVGGWLSAWYEACNGAQEEKFSTIVPEMMLATEALREMGASLLSNGSMDPWLPQGGWYIIGAGSYIQSLGYPKWGTDRIPLRDEDYFDVGVGRRMRKRGLVAIMARPCNDRGSCKGNIEDDPQYRCYNRQVEDRDFEASPSANLWGIAAGAFNLASWPRRTRQLLQTQHIEKTWVLQAGGWGAGAFGCGTLYNGLVQAAAAKRGGWSKLRMCYATKEDPHPTIESRLGFVLANPVYLEANHILHVETYRPLMNLISNPPAPQHSHDMSVEIEGSDQGTQQPALDAPRQRQNLVPHNPQTQQHKAASAVHYSPVHGGNFLVFTDAQFGAVVARLYTKIDQKVIPPSCESQDDLPESEQAPMIKCNKPGAQGNCLANMAWCCGHSECDWYLNPAEDLRDFTARVCNPLCASASHGGKCKLSAVPLLCRANRSGKPQQEGLKGKARDYHDYSHEEKDADSKTTIHFVTDGFSDEASLPGEKGDAHIGNQSFWVSIIACGVVSMVIGVLLLLAGDICCDPGKHRVARRGSLGHASRESLNSTDEDLFE